MQAALIGFAAAVIYFLVAKLSLVLAYEQANTSAVWPTSGLAMGGLVVFGLRFWPAVTAGALVLTLSIDAGEIGRAVAISCGNTLEALIGAVLIKRLADGRNCLRRVSTVFRFIVFAALLAPLFSAGFGASALNLTGGDAGSSFGEMFLTWYTGNAAGILVFAPLVMLWSPAPPPRWKREQVIEGAVLLVVLTLVGQAICGFFLTEIFTSWPSAYLVIPILLWIAIRLGRGGTVAALIVLMAIAVAGTARGFPVFPGQSPSLSLLYLQVFLSVVSMMSLIVASLVAELRAAKESLEQQVETRTRRLEQMMREKDDLMAIAAHDLKAPLAGMRNILQLVRSRPETLSAEATDRVLLEMENTTDGMLDLVSSLLVAKRAEELDMSLTLISCDAVGLLARMVEMHRHVASGRGINFKVDTPQRLLVCTHPESFSQIISNLLANAVRFSPAEGNIHVGLRTDSDKCKMILDVSDEGPGIAADEVETIFEKFRRANNQPAGGEPSHGIGLYIVDKLTTALGGDVRYADARRGGSRFTVTLPASPAPISNPR